MLDKAPRLSISIVIWIFSSDTICQLNQFNTNSEAAMLSTLTPFGSLLLSLAISLALSVTVMLPCFCFVQHRRCPNSLNSIRGIIE